MTSYEFFSVMVDALDEDSTRWNSLFVLARLFELPRDEMSGRALKDEKERRLLAESTLSALVAVEASLMRDDDQLYWTCRLVRTLLEHLPKELLPEALLLMENSREFSQSSRKVTLRRNAEACASSGYNAYCSGWHDSARVLFVSARDMFSSLGQASDVVWCEGYIDRIDKDLEFGMEYEK